MHCRVAQSAGIGELDSSIAKDLIDSEDPKHTQFCREIAFVAFVAIYALFRDDISILWYVIQIDFSLLMDHKNIFAIDRKYFLLIEQIGYR